MLFEICHIGRCTYYFIDNILVEVKGHKTFTPMTYIEQAEILSTHRFYPIVQDGGEYLRQHQ